MTIYAAVLETEGFTVGQDNSRSGLFRKEDDGGWTSLGWTNIRNFGIAISPDYLFLASGNGVLRSSDDGATWRVTTDWKITEVLDVAIDPSDPHKLVIGTAHGIYWSPDDGDNWHRNDNGLTSTFVQSLVPTQSGIGPLATLGAGSRTPQRARGTLSDPRPIWLAGTEDGLFMAPNPEAEWMRAGLAGIAARRIAINPAGVCAVATDGTGLWLRDGDSWNQVSPLATDASFYAAAVSDDGQSIATGGYQSGVHLSRDGGATWRHLTDGLTNLNIQSLSFRPEGDELWVGTSGGGVFRLERNSWVSEGLPGSTIRKLYLDTTR